MASQSFTIHPDDFHKFTPVMQQYLNARHGLKDKSVLFFRMGDFYETFFHDAELAAKELEITLTGRPESNYPGGRIPMAGVPSKAMEPYAAKLIERGYRVCIAEQMADPSKCKGLVPREITKVLTPGTVSDLNLVRSYKNNFIAAVFTTKKSFPSDAAKRQFGFSYADVTTGEFYLAELSEDQLYQELARISPAELLLASQKAKKKEGEIEAQDELLIDLDLTKELEAVVSKLDKKSFDYEAAETRLLKQFKLKSLDGFGIKKDDEELSFKNGVRAAGAIFAYLDETQQAAMSNFDGIKTYTTNEFMLLDASTRRNLELVKTTNGIYDGSLMSAIDRTSSNLGRRRLRAWIEQPLFNLESIKERQDSVKELIAEPRIRLALVEALNKIYDIERLANRIANESINPRELSSLKESLLLVPEISFLLEKAKGPYLRKMQNLPSELMDFIGRVELALTDSPPNTITEGGVIREGYNEELDEYLGLVNDSQTWLTNFQETERTASGIKNLKVNFNKVHGYFLETSRANTKLIPEHYVCKQTMVNTARYITEELKEFEEKITNAETRRNSLEHKLFTELKKSLSRSSLMLKEIAQNIANLDAIVSLATLADEHGYACPEINESNSLYIKEARHPVIEQKLSLGDFVPNNLVLGAESDENADVIVLTGPNMAGKSTYMRQNALVILLAQIGSFVPATAARIGLCDRIFTRIGASDDLSSGQSTFMVEMNETAAILNGMSEKSFIVLDEIGRGTSTYDGVAIAWSVIEFIAKTKKARTIFATHYHELADLETLFPNIVNYQMLVSETKNSQGKTVIEFLHKVTKGSADRSYGIEVARLAGLPKAVLSRAKSINAQLQTRDNTLASRKKVKDAVSNAINDDGDLILEKLPLFELGA